jgi:hypothetical protein
MIPILPGHHDGAAAKMIHTFWPSKWSGCKDGSYSLTLKMEWMQRWFLLSDPQNGVDAKMVTTL